VVRVEPLQASNAHVRDDCVAIHVAQKAAEKELKEANWLSPSFDEGVAGLRRAKRGALQIDGII